MGNCCSGGGAAEGKNNVRHKKATRVSNWSKTGVIGLRRASLKELPPEVGQVAGARVLDASNNHLERLPPGLPPSLQRVVLSCNRISDLEPLRHLTNLKVLILEGNRIERLPDWVGSELTKLEILSLGDNLLAELPPSLGRLQKLKQLLVSQNRLQRLPDELGDCASLEELDAHHNALTELPPSLGRLQRLKLLQLDANQIGALPPPVLRDCAALATISLHSNPISPEALQGTEGYAAFEARRQSKATKSLATGVLLGRHAMDEGVDRAADRGPPTP